MLMDGRKSSATMLVAWGQYAWRQAKDKEKANFSGRVASSGMNSRAGSSVREGGLRCVRSLTGPS